MEAMKASLPACRTWIVALAVIALSLRVGSTQQIRPMDYYLVQEGKIVLMKGGKGEPVEQEVTLPNNFKLTTNGMMVVQPGTEKPLKANQRVTVDGFWLAADGQLTVLEDHFAVSNGKLVMVKEGVAQPVT